MVGKKKKTAKEKTAKKKTGGKVEKAKVSNSKEDVLQVRRDYVRSLTIIYGNTYKHIEKTKRKKKKNEHGWKAYIRFEDQDGNIVSDTSFVDEIVFDMQGYFPTLRTSGATARRNGGKFETQEYHGWGTFDVVLIAHL